MDASKILLTACALLLAGSLSAQSIDLGRGELPVTVPAGHEGANPAPLVVLLHGYTSSGAGRELRDLDASLPGHESGAYLFEAGCRAFL